jgi:hypothetical protein
MTRQRAAARLGIATGALQTIGSVEGLTVREHPAGRITAWLNYRMRWA